MTDNSNPVTVLTPEPESIEALEKVVLEALDRLEGSLEKIQDEVQLSGEMLAPTPTMRQALQEAVQILRGLEPFFSGFDDRTQHLTLLFEIFLDNAPAEAS